MVGVGFRVEGVGRAVVFLARKTRLALPARIVDVAPAHPVAGFEGFYGRAHGGDEADAFVAEDYLVGG